MNSLLSKKSMLKYKKKQLKCEKKKKKNFNHPSVKLSNFTATCENHE